MSIMKISLIICLTIFLNLNAIAKKQEIKLQIHPWKSKCEQLDSLGPRKCAPPIPSYQARQHTIKLKKLDGPGSSAATTMQFNFEDSFIGQIKVYNVFPHADRNLPRYVQIQFWLYSPVELFCAQSVKLEMPFSMPPLLCGTMNDDERVGVTLITPISKPLSFD